jgi:hypothetical protein
MVHSGAAILLALLSLCVIPLLGAVPAAHASSVTIDDSTSCGSIGGSWTSGNSTCFITSYTVSPGDWLNIASGTTLTVTSLLSNDGGIQNYGTVNGLGRIVNQPALGLWNYGGTIKISNEFDNYGTLPNYGIIDVLKTGELENEPGPAGSIVNYGTGTINNYGDFWNGGATDNAGSIYSNSTFSDSGVLSNGGTITNAGPMSITDSGSIDNEGTIINTCSGTFTITGGGTFTGNPVQQSVCPPASIGAPEFPVSALGPLLITALLFPALVVMKRRFVTQPSQA